MQRITGRKLIPVIIVWCCLCITIINCDEKLLNKRSIIVSIPREIRKPGDSEPAKSSESLARSYPLNPKSENLSQHEKENTLSNITANNSTNLKLHPADITSNTSNSNVNNTSEVKPASNTTISNTTKAPGIPPKAPLPINTGALFRGVFVFLGLSVIVIAYIIFRCARLNKNRTQMVRKYGVLAHRQDVEMRPLPLDDEDEDDTTVFDASEVGIHDKQQQRSSYQ